MRYLIKIVALFVINNNCIAQVDSINYEVSIEVPSIFLTLKFITSYKILSGFIGISYHGKQYPTYTYPSKQPFFRMFGINTGMFCRLAEFKRRMRLVLQYNFQYSSKINTPQTNDISRIILNSLFLVIKKDFMNKWNCFLGIGMYQYARILKYSRNKDIIYVPYFLLGVGYYIKKLKNN